MKAQYFILLLIGLLLLISGHVNAQGCADAGFCTAGPLQSGRSEADSVKYAYNIGMSFSLGLAERGTVVAIPQLETGYSIGGGLLEVKLPLVIAYGDKGSHTGIGDIVCTYSGTIAQLPRNSKLIAALGARIGLGTANATDSKGMGLPMPYQSNLGTTDLIAGIALSGKYLKTSLGFQQPLVQYNRNDFVPNVIYTANGGVDDYFASRQLQRKGDLLLRAEASYSWRRFAVSGGPLVIYHLGKDRIGLQDGRQIVLQGSDGITLNLAGSLNYKAGAWKPEFSFGSPVIVREYRADGLTRAFVATLRLTRYF